MKRKLMTLMLGVVALIPNAAQAQEFGLSQSIIDAYSGDFESQIVIRVRKPGDRSNLCGTRAGMINDDYNFPRPGSVANNYDFPHPGSSNYFQLPTGSRNPDMIGCIDRTRNLVFINIFKAIANPQPKAEPAPYNPNQTPIYSPNR